MSKKFHEKDLPNTGERMSPITPEDATKVELEFENFLSRRRARVQKQIDGLIPEDSNTEDNR